MGAGAGHATRMCCELLQPASRSSSNLKTGWKTAKQAKATMHRSVPKSRNQTLPDVDSTAWAVGVRGAVVTVPGTAWRGEFL